MPKCQSVTNFFKGFVGEEIRGLEESYKESTMKELVLSRITPMRYAVALLLILCLGVGNAWGASETLTWALTSNTNCSGGTNVSGSAVTPVNGSTYMAGTWSISSSKYQSESKKHSADSYWEDLSSCSTSGCADPTATARLEFPITINSGYSFTITGISLSEITNQGGSGPAIQIYVVQGSTKTWVGGNYANGSLPNLSNLNINLSAGSAKVVFVLGVTSNLSNGRGFKLTGLTVSGTSATAGTSHSVTATTEDEDKGTSAAASASVLEGGTTTITATPKSGYQFDHWTVSGAGASLSSTTTNPTTLTMGTADATVTAYFAKKVCPSSGTLYSLTMKSATLSSVAQNTEVALATTYATDDGGTSYIGNKNSDGGKAQVSSSNSGMVYFNGADAYVKIVLDCPIKTGDELTFTNGSGSNQICFTTTNSRSTTYTTTSNSYTFPAAFNDVSTIYVWRSSGSSTYMHSLTITRPAACTAPNHVDISGNYHFFPGETLELTATAYSSEGTGSPIAAANITGYQWQKYIVDTWTNIAGETSATYTKENATNSDVGQYR